MLSDSREATIPLQTATTFLYKPNDWLAKINFINHLLLFNDLMIVVMAEQGGGKTSFINLLQENLNEEININLVDAKTPLAEAQILTELEKFCNLPTSRKPQLSELVKQVNHIKKHLLIVIDNAHCLKENFLKNLLEEVRKYQHNFFHICLTSDFSLNPLLNSLHGDSFKDLIHTIELGPLSKKETRKYLLKKLPLSKSISKSLTDKCVSEFYNLTSGHIAKINDHLEPFFNLNKTNQAFFLKRINLMIGLLLLTLFIVYLGKIKVKAHDNQTPKFSNSFKPTLFAENKRPNPEIRDLDYQINTSIKKSINSALEQVFTIERKIETTYVSHYDFIADGVSMLAKAYVEEQGVILPKSNLEPIKSFFKKANLVDNDNAKNQHFTIQLMAGPNKETIQRFLANNTVLNAQIKHIKLKEKDWFILTLGQYNQAQQAKIALNHLPPALIKLRPWVRSIPLASIS